VPAEIRGQLCSRDARTCHRITLRKLCYLTFRRSGGSFHRSSGSPCRTPQHSGRSVICVPLMRSPLRKTTAPGVDGWSVSYRRTRSATTITPNPWSKQKRDSLGWPRRSVRLQAKTLEEGMSVRSPEAIPFRMVCLHARYLAIVIPQISPILVTYLIPR